MTFSIKAVETRYRGYRMRSRSEARFAVFLDALSIRWDYEVETADLGKDGWYLPDFWLPDLGIWIEIKGAAPTFDEQRKARALAIQSENPVYVFFGGMNAPTRAAGPYFRIAEGFRALAYGAIRHVDWARLPYPNYSFVWAECYRCHGVGVVGVGPALEVTGGICPCPETKLAERGPNLNRAYEAARSARFERGENGTPG